MHGLLRQPPNGWPAARLGKDELGPCEAGTVENEVDGSAAAPAEQNLGLVHHPSAG
jgi:hypothetical protein